MACQDRGILGKLKTFAICSGAIAPDIEQDEARGQRSRSRARWHHEAGKDSRCAWRAWSTCTGCARATRRAGHLDWFSFIPIAMSVSNGRPSFLKDTPCAARYRLRVVALALLSVRCLHIPPAEVAEPNINLLYQRNNLRRLCFEGAQTYAGKRDSSIMTPMTKTDKRTRKSPRHQSIDFKHFSPGRAGQPSL